MVATACAADRAGRATISGVQAATRTNDVADELGQQIVGLAKDGAVDKRAVKHSEHQHPSSFWRCFRALRIFRVH
jgi:hypothetical protein